ncbi:MAG: ABC transporter substrate-binding protein [Spirochaetaceae bacterium]|jgi:NitT/TauT family transport system substrate-binding protein|nr:ABC transporter substrate-binding protein [Spirochaetaceae bacterium]
MKKKVLVFLVVAAVLLGSCSKKTNEKYPLGEYDLVYSGSTCGSPISIAQLKGYYDEQGIKINLVSGTTFESTRAALDSGKVPLANGDFQFFPSIQNGVDIKLIAGLHEGCIKIIVPVDSPIKTLLDLKDKTIAVDEIGGTPMSVASVAAGSVGINPKEEIKWVPYPNDLILEAVKKGDAQVVAAWDPFATQAENSGEWRVLLDIATDPLFAGRNCCFLFASGDLIKKNPKVIASTLRAIQNAVAFEGAHPQEAAELLIKEKKVATDDVALVSGLLGHYKYGEHSSRNDNAKAKEDAVYFAGWLSKIGYLDKDLDAQKFIDDMWVDIYDLESAAQK